MSEYLANFFRSHKLEETFYDNGNVSNFCYQDNNFFMTSYKIENFNNDS